MEIFVNNGNIVYEPADALLLNHTDHWMFNRIHRSIVLEAGPALHDEARAAFRSHPLAMAVTVKNRYDNPCRFAHIIFLVDDGTQPLETVIARGLSRASRSKFARVTLPIFRLPSLTYYDEAVFDANIAGIARALHAQAAQPANRIQTATVVVDHDPATKYKLQAALHL